MFAKLTQAMTNDEKARIAEQICTDLVAQATATDDMVFLAPGSCVDESMSDELAAERDIAVVLVGEILKGYPGESLFDAMVKVLAAQNAQVPDEEDLVHGITTTSLPFRGPENRSGNRNEGNDAGTESWRQRGHEGSWFE